MKSKHGKSVYSEYQTQKKDNFFGSFVFYIIYSTKVVGIDFKSGVWTLYYQRVSKT